MKSIEIEPAIAHCPSRALTRGTVDNCMQGKSMDKKLLAHLHDSGLVKRFRICNNKRCKTCPLANKEQIGEDIGLMVFCKVKNLIYLIQCETCKLNYIGQTCNEISIRINGHRSAIKKVIKNNTHDYELLHFQSHSFDDIAISIIHSNITNLQDRLNLENIYMCNFKTIFPYGLNSKLNGEGYYENDKVCIYNKFGIFQDFIKEETLNNKRFKRGKGKTGGVTPDVECLQMLCNKEFNWNNIIKLKNYIFGIRNKKLKWFCVNHLKNLKINSFFNILLFDLAKFKLGYNCNKSLFETDTRNIEYCIINFLDIDFENLKLPQIFHKNSDWFPIKENTDIKIAYKYCHPIKKKICNYNYYSKNLHMIKDNQCYCEEDEFREFIDTNTGHIITGNLNIIKSIKLRNIMEKGSKFRLRKRVNKLNCVKSICKDLDIFIAKIARKCHWPIEGFLEWKHKIIFEVKNSFGHFNKNHGRKGIFYNKTLIKDIDSIKEKFIITVVDKAANNFCIMCKMHFKEIMTKEYNSNKTYTLIKSPKKEIDNRLLAFAKKINKKICNLSFPYLFPTVKFHKNPLKFRFVTCATGSYNHNIGKYFFKLLKLIYNKIKEEENFIINSNKEVINFLLENKIHSIHTFDFENLFTSIPQDKLIDACNNLFNLYLNDNIIMKSYWMELCKFNIYENYLFNGISYYRQSQGIPMGCSFSSMLADLFLHTFERELIKDRFIQAHRYIDDLILYGSDNFEFLDNCYPRELKLVKTNSSIHKCNYLDLNIEICGNNISIGLYDKREDFNFCYIALSNFQSNLNYKIFKNLILSQFFRIKKICNNKLTFEIAIKNFQKILKINEFPDNYMNINTLIHKETKKFF